MSSFSLMFSSGRIGSLKTKNRLVMPPMVRNYADAKGMVTKQYVDHIQSIARGGVGVLILEASFISPEGKGFVKELGLHTDSVIPGLKKLVRASHACDAKIGIQLYHAGRQTSSRVTGTQPLAPSPIPDPTMNEMPRELSLRDIARLVNAYGDAARRAKAAGFDFVEIHGAHGYLITQFLSSFSNRRRDAYGGTPDRRRRFLREVFASVRAAVGPDYPITVRLSGDEMVPRGLSLRETTSIAQELEGLGAAALHISVGNYASYARGYMIPPMAMEDGPLLQFAARIKKVVDIPVIAVGKLRTPEIIEKALKDNVADFAAIGRTLLADPEWPQKVKEGKINEIHKCIACNQGCISRLFAQQDVWCTVNPATSREALFAKKPKVSKNVLIIGGGPAGLSAAKTAAERGHRVTVYEERMELGGQVIAAGSLPHRRDWLDFLQILIRDVQRLRVTLKVGHPFALTDIQKGEFDVAIVAMGSRATRPNIPGADRTTVVSARDVVEGWAKADGKIVVVGGGCMGAQVAELLATNGRSVTIVEAMQTIAADAPTDDRALLLARLRDLHVKIVTSTKVLAIGERGVTIEGAKRTTSVSADTVVMCLGSTSNNGITRELKKLVKKVVVVGDALKPRRVTEAVAEGALAAVQISSL